MTNIQVFQPSSEGLFPTAWTLISLAGPDSQDFLHRLSTVDVKRLAVGHGALGCFLTQQGKFRAHFRLWRMASDECWFEFASGRDHRWKTQILEWIDQFTFGEKMKVGDPTDGMSCLWFFPESAERFADLRAGETAEVPDMGRLFYHGESYYGRPWFSLWGSPSVCAAWAAKYPLVSERELEQWRIQQGSSKVDLEISDQSSPLEVGLRASIADQKGCYPGQEVIEKVISLGSPARRLVRIEGTGALPQLGDSILNFAEPPMEIGFVTSLVQIGDTSSQFAGLGLVKKSYVKARDKIHFASAPGTEGVMIQITRHG
jgi:folate-binding protein YgfZ